MSNLPANIIDFFRGVNYLGWQQNVKIIFLILTFIFLFVAVFAYLKAHFIMRDHRKHMLHEHAHAAAGGEHGGEHHTEAPEHAAGEGERSDAWAKAWEHIQQYVNSPREAEWKLSVIEADKFVDEALKARGFVGETMGERLMLIKPQELTSIQDLWDAHKLRNLLVHETNYQLKHDQAFAAIHAFEKVLRELGFLS
ncbi:MAG: hypothetical protein AAB420_02995 [Patescibacteria group bacterium]